MYKVTVIFMDDDEEVFDVEDAIGGDVTISEGTLFIKLIHPENKEKKCFIIFNMDEVISVEAEEQ